MPTASHTRKLRLLSAAMWRALEDFADAGGHGYGEYAHLSKRTAQALARRGLVELGHRDLGGGRYMAWGHATEAGRERLRRRRRAAAWRAAEKRNPMIITFHTLGLGIVRRKLDAAYELFGELGPVDLYVSADPLITNVGEVWCRGRPELVRKLGRKVAYIDGRRPGTRERFDPTKQGGPVRWQIFAHFTAPGDAVPDLPADFRLENLHYEDVSEEA